HGLYPQVFAAFFAYRSTSVEVSPSKPCGGGSLSVRKTLVKSV
ncbi:unnamed protein product, partial [Brassica rapa subsp. trilocularis]